MTVPTQNSVATGIQGTSNIEEGTVTVVAEIGASPDRVFRALTDPAELVQWWGAPGIYRSERWAADLRAGGEWKCYIVAPDGSAMSDPRTREPQSVGGQYITVDPPRVLEFTWSPSWDDFKVTTVRYELEHTNTGTRLRVIHRGFVDRPDMGRDHADGWLRVFAWLNSWIVK